MRLLLVGWLNSQHVVTWAEELLARGWEVHAAGEVIPDVAVELPAAVASVQPFPVLGPPGFAARRLIPRLRAIEAQVRPDVVHAHWVTSFGWIAAKAGGRPLVVSAWGSDLLRAGPLVRPRNRAALRAADLAMADSAHLAGIARGIAPGTPVEVVNWGIDLATFTPGDGAAVRAAAGIPGDAPVVLHPRDLKPLYNVSAVLQAFARVRSERPDARLVLKHPLPAAPEPVRAEIDRLGLGDAVVEVARTSLEELVAWYRAADVVVSIPDTDSSPRSVWEALACGAPVVVSDLPWARAALGPAARLVAPEPGAVARAVLATLDDPGDLAAARALVERVMDRRAEMDRVDGIYRELASRR